MCKIRIHFRLLKGATFSSQSYLFDLEHILQNNNCREHHFRRLFFTRSIFSEIMIVGNEFFAIFLRFFNACCYFSHKCSNYISYYFKQSWFSIILQRSLFDSKNITKYKYYLEKSKLFYLHFKYIFEFSIFFGVTDSYL